MGVGPGMFDKAIDDAAKAVVVGSILMVGIGAYIATRYHQNQVENASAKKEEERIIAQNRRDLKAQVKAEVRAELETELKAELKAEEHKRRT